MYRLVTSRKSLFQSSLNGYSSEASGLQFQSTLPRGSDVDNFNVDRFTDISIHAPSRERRPALSPSASSADFNPRSLAGATLPDCWSC